MVWDLSAYFSSTKDKDIEKCFKKAEQLSVKLLSHKGKLKKHNLKQLVAALLLYQELSEVIDLPLDYANLKFSEDSESDQNKAFISSCQERALAVSKKSIWFELELGSLNLSTVKKLSADKKYKKFAHFVARAIQYSKHRLSERDEELLSTFDLTGKQAFWRLYDQERIEQSYLLKAKNGRDRKVSETELLHNLYSPDRKLRKLSADALTVGLQSGLKRSAYITNVLALNKSLEDKERRFESPEASRHLANDIDEQTVNAMLKAVEDGQIIVKKYYQYKSKLLGINKLQDYDRYAPVKSSDKIKISFTQAKQIILKSFASFSPQYAELAAKFFDSNWIDIEPRAGKRSGAFCSFGTPKVHPVVLLNYKGTVRDVSTLAHELGHAIHGWLMRESGYLNYRVPLTLAETASVFSEMLVFDHLYKSIESAEQKRSVLMGKIEDTIATVFRQVAMFRFEQDMHRERRESGELSERRISELWRKRQLEMFAGSVNLRSEYNCWWSYIPHFIHTPFYVYAYAFGEILSLSIYALYKDNPKSIAENYIEILKSGSTASPETLFKMMNIDIRKPAFWSKGISVISDLVSELR